jgi:hypothetical protein
MNHGELLASARRIGLGDVPFVVEIRGTDAAV